MSGNECTNTAISTVLNQSIETSPTFASGKHNNSETGLNNIFSVSS